MALGILCPGQGGQHAGMLDILSGYPEAAAILAALGTMPTPDEAFANRVAQPLVCAVEAATWAVLRDRLPAPVAIAGYSVGELAAHHCAGGLGAAEMVALARRRAELMDAACPVTTGLVAVAGLALDQVAALAGEHGVEVSIVNDRDRVVVGGTRDAIASFGHAVARLGAKVTDLPVAIASHTSLMRPAVESFRRLLDESSLAAPVVPVLAGIDGVPVYTRKRAIDTLAAQVARTVEWASCLEGMAEMGCSVLLELGPGNALARMARERLPHLAIRSVSEFQSLDGVVSWTNRA